MFKISSPKHKAYLTMLKNAEPFLNKYKKMTGYNKFEEFKESLELEYNKNNLGFENINDYCDFVLDRTKNHTYNREKQFLFCYSPETKEFKEKIRKLLFENKFLNCSKDNDKLYWFEIEECFKEKNYPNIITDMFEIDLKRSWFFREKIHSFFNTIFHIILIIGFIILITFPIWIQALTYFNE